MIKILKNPYFRTQRGIKLVYFWLGLILILGFIVRLYDINRAIADWHSWRQVDTSAVTRSFYEEGFNPFIPRYEDMIGVDNQKTFNPNRYRFVEFPIYNMIVYFFYLLNGGVNIIIDRLVSIMMSLGSVVFLFLIVRKAWGDLTGLMSSLVFAVLPFSVYFSRTTLPESTLVFFTLGAFYFINRWIFEETKKLFALSAVFAATALLVKPMAIFYFLPLLYSYWQKERRIWPIPVRYFFLAGIALAPLAAWREWMTRFPEGIPQSDWLFNGSGIRFRPAFFQWILNERFGKEILTVPGTFLFFLGLIKKDEKGNLLLHLLALSSFLYLIVFATGNVTHDYYQYLIVPVLSMFLARGIVLLLRGIPGFVPRFWTIPLAVLFFVLTLYFDWETVSGFYQINNDSIVVAGDYANKVLPKDAKVVAPWGGDSTFLFQTNRPGLAIMALPPDQLVQKYGIDYYISVNYDADTNKFMREYKILKATKRFVLLDIAVKDDNPNKVINIENN